MLKAAHQKEATVARLEVITGPMFSGKSEELIRRLRREGYTGKKILAVKPRIDIRTEELIAARSKGAAGKFERTLAFIAKPVDNEKELAALVLSPRNGPDILGVDEAQFFGPWFADLVRKLLLRDYIEKIIVAGLDMDAWGRPFGPMPTLLAMADDVRKETAVCFKCRKASAMMTQKTSKGSGSQIEVGDAGLYEARCRNCWTPPED